MRRAVESAADRAAVRRRTREARERAEAEGWYDRPRPRGRAHSVGTGKNAHPELQAIAELVHGLDEPIEIRVGAEPADWQRQLVEALGGKIVIDPRAPRFDTHDNAGVTRAERRRLGLPVYELPLRSEDRRRT